MKLYCMTASKHKPNTFFHFLEPKLSHQDDSSSTLSDTKGENATEAPIKSLTGRKHSDLS